MCRRPPLLRGHQLLWLVFFFSSAALGFVLAYQWTSSRVAEPRIPLTAPPAGPAGPAAATGPIETSTQPLHRTEAMTPAPGTPPLQDFVQWIDELTAHAVRTAQLCEADRLDDARTEDRQATQQFAALMACYADAGERAVALVSPSTDSARHAVLRLVIATDCARRHDATSLVTTVLTAVIHSDIATSDIATNNIATNGTAASIGDILVDKPWLRATHETAVLELVAGAEHDASRRSLATGLLWTLWDNMLRHGERSASQMRNLAMMLLADVNACKRTVACRYLLLDPEHRSAVLAWLRQHADPATTGEITRLAATDLPPAEAMAVLRQLATVAPSLTGAYMVLATRSTAAVTSGYYELLASDTHPTQRRDLIAGLGMATDVAEARAAIELALTADNAAEVRVQAMLSLCALAPEDGEAACHRILDHPGTAKDADALAVVVFALQNLEAAGMQNAVDRLGQRLRACPLRAASRELLDRLLTEGLPTLRLPHR